jgi:hypothetical protein
VLGIVNGRMVKWGFGVLKSDNVVARLYICDTLADGLDDTGTLVTEHNGEGTLGVLSGQCVGIWRTLVYRSMQSSVASSCCSRWAI